MDATVARQKASQAISWIVKNTNPLNPVPVGVPTYVKDKEEKDKLVFKSQGTNVQYLNKNEDIVFHQGADIGANFVKLCETELRRIANAVKVPYHQLTGDTSGIDFSTLRAITIELRVRMEHVHQTQTIAMGLAPLTKYFKALASRYKNVGSAEPTYQMPRQYGVDELKDAQADLLEIQYGMATLESKLQERHTTFEEIVEDCRRREELKQFGIDFAAMPQSTNQSTNVEANAKSTSL
jgi:capsid protein